MSQDDSGESELKRLNVDVALGKLNVVVCETIGDIGSRLPISIIRVKAWCEKNIRIVLLDEDIEFSGKSGRHAINMMLVLCHSQDKHTRERHKAGVERARKQGKYKGRLKGTTKKNPEKALELRDKGMTVEEIAEKLGVSTRTAFRYLSILKGCTKH